MPERNDTTLLLAAGKGDRPAFGELVERHHRGVIHFVHRFLSTADRATAEDIAQEVFLAAWKAAPGFNPRAAVRTWLWRIATNICLNHNRTRRRKPTVPLAGEPAAAGHSANSTNPESAAIDEEQTARLEAAVAALPAGQRSAILLRHFHDLSYAEIASVLQTSVSAVESLLFRGRQNLKKAMESEIT